eukprot:SAG22_NODE_664_length_8022_cov_2.639576_2_plen_103_part_00
MMPYFHQPLDTPPNTAGAFFARIVGLLFLALVAGYAKLGVPAAAFSMQTLVFHFGTLYWFYQAAVSDDTLFVCWIWQAQLAANLVFGLWGLLAVSTAGAKQD